MTAAALKLAHDSYFYLGASRKIRDSIARVLPFWQARGHQRDLGCVLGFWSFGLEECRMFREAEAAATRALEINPMASACHGP